jgi:hypothetical protein
MRSYFLFFILISFFALAQPGGGGDPGAGEPVPFAGIGYLILGGALLGIRSVISKMGGLNREKRS